MANQSNRVCLGGTTALLVVLAAQGHAQDINTTPLGRIVSSWGTDQVALDTPQAVTVIDRTEIEQQQATTVGELFDQVPGVQAIGSDRVAGQTFNIRGFGEVPSGDEGRVILQQDGAPKYYEQYRLGGFFADPSSFCNIEVLSGPASATLYGGGAIGGVIRFETCTASDFLEQGERDQLRFTLGVESNGVGGNVGVRYAQMPNENTELLYSFNFRRGDDFEDGDGNLAPGSSFTAATALFSGRFHLDGGRSITASYEIWNSDLDDTVLDQTDGSPTFGTVDRSTRDQTLSLGYESEEDFGDLEVTFSFSNTDVSQTEADTGSPFISCGPGILEVLCAVDYGYRTFALDSRVTQNGLSFGGSETTVVYGATLTRQIRFGETEKFGAINFHPEGTSNRLAIFGQAEMDYGNGLTLVPGLRIEAYQNSPGDSVSVTGEDVDFVGISWKLAFTYDASDQIGLFGSVAQTQRAPTLDELYSFDPANPSPPFGPPTAGTTPALDLDPETARSIEVGITYSDFDVFQPGDALDARATLFYSRVADLIENGPDGGAEYVNVDDAEIYGLEFAAAYESERFFARSAFSFIQGTDLSDGSDWSNTPQPSLAFTIGKRLPEMGLEFGWRANIYGELDVNGDVTDASNVHDIFVDYQPQSGVAEGMNIRFGVSNVFDTTYQTALGSDNDNARGRSFRLTATKAF
jgi:hemoglobin/transferrin/lactoferrin receptor protein